MAARILLFATLLFCTVIAREVILLGFFSIVVAVLLSFPINLINKVLPRSISVIATLVMLITFAVTFVAIATPTVSKQINLIQEQLPEAIQKMQKWIIGAEQKAKAIAPQKSSAHSEETPKQNSSLLSGGALGTAAQLTTKAFSVLINVLESMTTVILIVIMGAFLAYDSEGYRMGLRSLVPKSYESDFDEAWHRVAIGLKHWVGGIFIEMLIMGTFAGVGLWIAGIDGAAALGILTFFGTFIPYLGAIASSIPGLLMGIAKSPHHLLYAMIVYAAVHIIEGYIVSPFVMKHAIQLRPALLLFWQAFMGSLFGIIGIVVATPLLASLKASIGYLYIERKLGKEAPRI